MAVSGGRPVLWKGAAGLEVALLQGQLNEKVGTELVVDGIFGPLTEGAIKHFQSTSSIQVTGVMGHLSWWVLNYATAS